MEKDIYEIIKDWYELFQNGIITEEEFIAKKKELLDNRNPKAEKTLYEPLIAAESFDRKEYDKYEEIYEEESFFLKNRLLIILAVICLLIFGYYYNENIENKENLEPIIGTYIVIADENNLVHFYTEPDINTERRAYFSTSDTVYVSAIQNNFGYIEYENDKNQKSKGWIKLENLKYYQK